MATMAAIEDAHQPFSIKAPPKTDIWRPSPSDDVFTAPCSTASISLSTFKSMIVTVRANWKTLDDQGGLILEFSSTQPNSPSRWIKCGIEFEGGKRALSAVGTGRFSDWSLSPMDVVGE